MLLQNSLPSTRLHKPDEGSVAQQLTLEQMLEVSGWAVSTGMGIGVLQSSLVATDSFEKRAQPCRSADAICQMHQYGEKSVTAEQLVWNQGAYIWVP